MKFRPLLFTILTVVFLIEPFTRIAVNYFLFDLGPIELLGLIFNNHWFINLPMSVLMPLIGLALLRPSKFSLKFIKVALLIYIAFASMAIAQYIDEGMAAKAVYITAVLLTTMVAVGIAIFKYRSFFHDNKKRWWEQASRFDLLVPAKIKNISMNSKLASSVNDIQVVNVSTSGCMIEASDKEIILGEEFKICFSYGNLQVDTIVKAISSYSENRFGVIFIPQNREQKRVISKLSKALDFLSLKKERSSYQISDLFYEFKVILN